ncbi:VWA domain-containing protein [Candidatus Dependentiae bacterium]|nr:VWA domain-containing protein [Candidatus Dependentiae bacterium]
MNISEFESGYYLYLIPIVFAVLFFYRKKIFSDNIPSINYSSIFFIKQFSGNWKTKLRLPVFLTLRITVVSLLIIAAAGPRSGKEYIEKNISAIDIMILIDSSSSMQAEDFKPGNRLDSAKETAVNFIQNRKSDRIGIIEFAAGARLRCPLTQDYNIAGNSVKQINFSYEWKKEADDEIKSPLSFHNGTYISSALGMAGYYLKNSAAKSKVVILVTDGKQEGDYFDPATMAAALKKYNIKIYSILIGLSNKGVMFPIFYKNRGKRYFYNSNGTLPVIPVDEELLRNISIASDGKFYKASEPETLKQSFYEIDKLEKTDIKLKKNVEYKEYFQWFLLIAAVLLILELILKNTVFKIVNDI